MTCPPGQVLLNIGADAPICMSIADANAYAASALANGAQPPIVVNQTLSTLESDFGVSGTTLGVIGVVVGLVVLMSMMKR